MQEINCEVCNVTFCTEYDLKIHHLAQHNQSEVKTSSKEENIVDTTKTKEEANARKVHEVKCKICKVIFL
jgi:hypothetical protein